MSLNPGGVWSAKLAAGAKNGEDPKTWLPQGRSFRKCRILTTSPRSRSGKSDSVFGGWNCFGGKSWRSPERTIWSAVIVEKRRSNARSTLLRTSLDLPTHTMNSPPEPGSPSPTTPSSGSPPPDELQLPSAGNTQELDTDTSRFFPSQSKRTTRTGGMLRSLKLRKKEDTIISVGGKQERGVPSSATSSWVEGTQRAMKEELVDQAVADQLKRSEQLSLFLIRVIDEDGLDTQDSEIPSMMVC